MKALFTILFTGLLAFSVSAKEATYKGYIINANGLRIDGQIRTKNVTTDQMKITFVDGDTKIIYKPIDIIGYGYENIDENEFGEDVTINTLRIRICLLRKLDEGGSPTKPKSGRIAKGATLLRSN